MSPEWGPPIDWDAPLDGETTEDMLAELDRQHIEEEILQRRSEMMWEKYLGYYGRDGKLVITPPRIRNEES